MPGARLERDDIGQGLIRGDIGIADDKAGLVVFGALDHGRLILYRLRAVNEGHAPLGGQRNRQAVAGYRLHNGRHHGNVHGNRRLLPPAVLDQRRPEADIRRDALAGGIPRNQKVFIEGVGRFVQKNSHIHSPFLAKKPCRQRQDPFSANAAIARPVCTPPGACTDKHVHSFYYSTTGRILSRAVFKIPRNFRFFLRKIPACPLLRGLRRRILRPAIDSARILYYTIGNHRQRRAGRSLRRRNPPGPFRPRDGALQPAEGVHHD